MLFKFSSHTLEKSEDGYIVTLYMDTQTEEFSNEFKSDESSMGNDMLNKSIMSYIKQYLPDIKISLIKVMVGSAILLTITMTALESSLQIVQANTSSTQAQIQQMKDTRPINIILDGKLLETPQKAFISDDITYAPIREVSEALGAYVSWDESSNYTKITKEDIDLSFKLGNDKCILNNKNIDMPPSICVNGKNMLSLRFMSEVFGFNISWNDNLKVAIISSTHNIPTDSEIEAILPKPTPEETENTEEHYNFSQEDIYWLSRLVHAEASGESYNGKLAVANVILNRVKNKEFPDDVKSVIFDTKHGTQFTPIINGEIYKSPSNESNLAAMEALKGNNNAQNSLYFLNPRKATSSWIQKNRKYAFTIENHNFYL